jgi:electron transfer flavoprotein beta subunit
VKIVLCLKQIPSRDAVLKVNSTATWIDQADLSYEVNEPDIYALEAALQLKEKHGGEVVVCSLGPARVAQAIKESLAKGADRAIHLEDPAFDNLDVLGTARVLAAAIGKENPDLVLTGLQSEDSGFAQTGVILAELLRLPHSTIIMEILVEDGGLKVKRELEAGWFEWIEVPLPALLTIQSGINKPRYATLKGIITAKNKPIQKLNLQHLDLAADLLSPCQQISRFYVPERNAQTEFVEGSPQEIAVRLVDKLKNEVGVL